jgi:hypothetical protein
MDTQVPALGEPLGAPILSRTAGRITNACADLRVAPRSDATLILISGVTLPRPDVYSQNALYGNAQRSDLATLGCLIHSSRADVADGADTVPSEIVSWPDDRPIAQSAGNIEAVCLCLRRLIISRGVIRHDVVVTSQATDDGVYSDPIAAAHDVRAVSDRVVDDLISIPVAYVHTIAASIFDRVAANGVV